MATESEHRKQARHNQQLLNALDKNAFPDWAVTVAFYTAVHLVEALFANKGLSASSGSHTRRNKVLKRQFPALWKEYRPLYAFSRLARYRCYKVGLGDVSYIQRRLARIEQMVNKLST